MEAMGTSTEQGNHNIRESNHNPINDSEMLWDEVARPLKMVMTIFGLYHEKGTRKIHHESVVKEKIFFIIPKIYQILVVLFLWYNFLRAVASFWLIKTPDMLYDNVSVCTWGFLVAANNTIFLKICHKRNIVRLIANQSKLCLLPVGASQNERLNKNHVKPSWMKYRSFALAGSIVGLCGLCLNSAAILFMIYGTDQSSVSYKLLCLPWYSGPACGISSVFAVYGSAAWALAMVFIAFTCHILSGQLTQLTNDFTETFGRVQHSEANLLNSYRRKFSLLCRSVELADEMLSPLIAVAYCTNIPVIIFLLYQIWDRFFEEELSYVLIYSLWVMANAINIGVISYYAVTVHEKVGS